MKRPTIKALRWLIIIGAVCARPGFAEPRPVRMAADMFHASYLQWDDAGFERVIERCETALASSPGNADLWYWKGTAEFHLALHRIGETNAPRHRVVDLLKDARESFESLLEIEPEHGEAHALLANAIGLRIAQQPLSAVWRGAKVTRHKDRALERAPENPRVQYLLASSYYHAPHILKGKDRGLDRFLRAEELFEQEAARPAEPGDPRWGHNSCLAFIGRIYEDMGELRKARDYYARALEINPDGKMAGEGLARVREKL